MLTFLSTLLLSAIQFIYNIVGEAWYVTSTSIIDKLRDNFLWTLINQ